MASIERRALLGLGVAAVFAVAPHSPAWADLELDAAGRIYRRYALLIVGQRDDEVALSLTRKVVDVLARFLTDSRAQLARAADSRRVGLLLGTEQRDIAIMKAESADALFLGKPPFDDLRDVPLRLLASFGSHVLVCRSDFIDRHAYLVAQTLTQHRTAFPAFVEDAASVVPRHSGSLAFLAGERTPVT